MYRVFLGAPRFTTPPHPCDDYTWTTVSSSHNHNNTLISSSSLSSLPPPATLEAASRRISLMYQNAIFQDEDQDEEEYLKEFQDTEEDEGGGSTLITWPPTPAGEEHSRASETGLYNATSQFESQDESQESQSLNYSDSSSIARFPTFQFNLHSLTSLAAIRNSRISTSSSQLGGYNHNNKVNVLLAVLEVEGPDTIRTKKGPDAGKEISLLKMILGDEDGSVCKLTAWRETADIWGGSGPKDIPVKRGDVVLIYNVTAAHDPSTSPTLTASPNLKSKLEICYRVLPYTHEDLRLRPDLRLGFSDAGVRKVASVVRWFEKMAGLSAG